MIVNNESSEIIVMLNERFNEFAKNPSLDLNPPETREAQKAVDDWVYPLINNGVYKCGFARTQKAYGEAHKALYDGLDRMEELLSKQPFLTGKKMTLSDIRAFMTLVRFDECYVIYFKCSGKRIVDYPNILDYCKRIYKLVGKDSINMDHCKNHYYTSHPFMNFYAVVPEGNHFIETLQEKPPGTIVVTPYGNGTVTKQVNGIATVQLTFAKLYTPPGNLADGLAPGTPVHNVPLLYSFFQ